MQSISVKPKVLLLDMDGVIVRHPALFKVLTNRVTSFVRQKVNPHMKLEKAEKINQLLYSEFGHTVLGLQKVYDTNISNEDFCNTVYNKNVMDFIDILYRDEEYMEQAKEFQKLASVCNDKGVPIYIFSNANYQWCKSILEQMEIPWIRDDEIISCDSPAYHGVKNEVCLKPNKVTYTKAIQHIYKTTESKDELEMIYVDDKIRNLIPMLHNKYWKTVWMNTNPKLQDIHSEHMYTINDLNQLYHFI